MKQKDIEHIFERLRQGMVPERGLESFAVGIDTPLNELNRQMRMVEGGEGASKFLRGGYGCGKTFISQLTMLNALKENFAVAKIVVSTNDTPIYKFDEVYAKVVSNLQTSMARSGALADCIDRWIAAVEDRLIDEGEDEDSHEFDDKVKKRFESELADLSKEEAGADFIAVLRHYFHLKQMEDIPSAMQLLSWLGGSKNITAQVKRGAGIKGEITNKVAFTYLKGILSLIKRAGYAGLLIVVDEMETIMRMRSNVREKSLNGIRQILDATPEYKGLFWLFTGTPEFYDSRKGVAGLAPLNDRIEFRKSGEFINVRQPQLELKPFDQDRLIDVAIRLRELFPSEHTHRITNRVTDEFIHQLVENITSGFAGNVGIVPRVFLREFVDILDLVDQHEEYDPATAYDFTPGNLNPEEEEYIKEEGRSYDVDEVEF
jgi:hypothetical protein